METDARYSALDHGGLELAPTADDPEVVPGTHAPFARRSSNDQPETLHPGQYEGNTEQHGGYYGEQEKARHTSAPGYGEETRPAYISNIDAKGPGAAAEELQHPREPRRYCGMRKVVFIGLIVLLVVVIIGAVVGAVCGVLLSRHGSSRSTPPPPAETVNSTTNSTSIIGNTLQATPNTGFAVTVAADGSGRLLMYYQDPDGRIIENSNVDGSWSLADNSKINQSVVTTDATSRSPLTAVSYVLGGQTYRQLFYFDSTGLVQTTNSTTTSDGIATSWGTPYPISDDAASTSGTAGLAACVDPSTGMKGIRVYYGSGYGYIQEVGYQFNNTARGWEELNGFSGSDPDSGVACVVYDEDDEQYVNVYMRNTTGTIEQNYWDFIENDGWSTGPVTPGNMSIASGTAIAACNDDAASEYVLFQLSNGTVTRGLVDPAGESFEQFNNLATATSKTKLAAAFVDGGALYTFQNSSSASTMWATDVSRTLVAISDESIP